ncbi:hypothetical protein Dimus_021049 [Dionaea muscipula]
MGCSLKSSPISLSPQQPQQVVCLFVVGLLTLLPPPRQAYAADDHSTARKRNTAGHVIVNVSSHRPIPHTLFGIFFEEINHAGDGGLWAELVANRGFEAGGQHSPSCIAPWGRVGDDETVYITTELNSCFKRNKVALRMDVLCDKKKDCPSGGVGIFNPGNGGMNIEEGKRYNVVFYARSSGTFELAVSFATSDGSHVIATHTVRIQTFKWKKFHIHLKPVASYTNARLQLTSTVKGTVWLDQVSAMPQHTYKGHGYRIDLMKKLLALKPRFLRFPGGCYVEGTRLMNAFRWKDTVGPWEERPGHYGDVWNYWSDDALGYLEYLQLAEDLGARPVWVINNGIGHQDEVDTSLIAPFVQEMLDSIEFARGSPGSKWGSVRAKMGHPKPFDLKHIAVGNEDCGKQNYKGNYLKFYDAIKQAYPDIQVITNCDGSRNQPIDHPADLYDYHTYTSPDVMFAHAQLFDDKPRSGPKAFVSEYAVTEPGRTNDNGTLVGAISEAAFLIGIERNSDVVEMASYAPLFARVGSTQWKPDAIFFNSSESYGIPSYWMQTFFIESNGAKLLNTNVRASAQAIYNGNVLANTRAIISSAIRYVNKEDDKKNYIRIKVVNFQDKPCDMRITLKGVNPHAIKGRKRTVLSGRASDQNSLDNPNKVVPKVYSFNADGAEMDVVLEPYSLTAFDLLDESKSN